MFPCSRAKASRFEVRDALFERPGAEVLPGSLVCAALSFDVHCRNSPFVGFFARMSSEIVRLSFMISGWLTSVMCCVAVRSCGRIACDLTSLIPQLLVDGVGWILPLFCASSCVLYDVFRP